MQVHKRLISCILGIKLNLRNDCTENEDCMSYQHCSLGCTLWSECADSVSLRSDYRCYRKNSIFLNIVEYIFTKTWKQSMTSFILSTFGWLMNWRNWTNLHVKSTFWYHQFSHLLNLDYLMSRNKTPLVEKSDST